MDLLRYLDNLPDIVKDIVILIGLAITAYLVFKSKAAKTYKETNDALEARISQLEADSKRMLEENKELHAQINQLIGENKTLSKVVAKPDDEFKKTVKSILGEMKHLSEQQTRLAKEFVDHAKADDTRFANINQCNAEIKTEILANRDFYAKTIKELKK